MPYGDSLKPAAAAPQGEDAAKRQRTAAAVKLKTFGNWMLRTFVPIVPVNENASRVRFPANVRNAFRNFSA